MPKKKRLSLRNLPPCPDPEQFVLVRTKEGNFWRRKRGTVKPATINKALSRNNDAYKIIMPAASRIIRKLEPYTRSLRMGRITVNIAGRLLKQYRTTDKIEFQALDNMEFQKDHPLEKILLCDYTILQGNKKIVISIHLKKGKVQQHNNLVTDYYFDAVMLYGDLVNDTTLHAVSKSSALISFADGETENVELVLPMPTLATNWMLLLKLSCLEGNELAMHPKHYGMKVVKTGN